MKNELWIEKYRPKDLNNLIGDFSKVKVGAMDREELVNRMIVGGFPLVQDLDEAGRRNWFNGYITAIIERDVKDYAHIEGLVDFPDLLYFQLM